MIVSGYLVLETGDVFPGEFLGGSERAGEVVFNTGHSGYEEMATDPSYFSQILVLTAPMQGNYGASENVWESRRLWIEGFICVEMQSSTRDKSWLGTLLKNKIPVLSGVDTRKLVLQLREIGTVWGAVVDTADRQVAMERAKALIEKGKSRDPDWVGQVSRPEAELIAGTRPDGPRVLVMDFGCKENTLRELVSRCSEIKIVPAKSSVEEIKEWKPDGILLSNGPGDPASVQGAADTVRALIGWRPIFGICMGHQILALALGAKTYKLKFGHRGANHPMRDELLGRIYVTSQNHGYAVERETLPTGVRVTHTNLNDGTVSGIQAPELKCFSVQFHPESHPGPHDAEGLFDFFVNQLR